MRVFRRLAVAVLLPALFGAGCLYSNIRVPLDTDFDRTELGTRQGTSCSKCLLWLVAWGDGGTRAAAEAAPGGPLTVIRHADREIYSVLLGLYTEVRTVVYGD